MKRSEINRIMSEADELIRRLGFVLPPFAYWTPEAFKAETSQAFFRSPSGMDVLPTSPLVGACATRRNS